MAKPQKSMSVYSNFRAARDERIDQSCLFNSSLSQHGREKTVWFVGEKCLVKCNVTRHCAQVSMVSKSYLMKNYPELTVKPLKEI